MGGSSGRGNCPPAEWLAGSHVRLRPRSSDDAGHFERGGRGQEGTATAPQPAKRAEAGLVILSQAAVDFQSKRLQPFDRRLYEVDSRGVADQEHSC